MGGGAENGRPEVSTMGGEIGDGGVMTKWERMSLGMEASMGIGTKGPQDGT